MTRLEIGRTIRIIRQAKGITARALAAKAKVSVPFVSLIESGERQPSLAVLRRLARALGVPSEVLILLAMPQDSALGSASGIVHRLTESISKLAEAEEALRRRLVREGKRETT